MAYETPILDTTLPSGVDLSTSQFYGVVVDASGFANTPAAGANIAGVVQGTLGTFASAGVGQVASVRVEGITKMVAGSGGIALGNYVKVDNTGKAVNSSSGDKIVGICLLAATSGDIGTVLLKSGVAV